MPRNSPESPATRTTYRLLGFVAIGLIGLSGNLFAQQASPAAGPSATSSPRDEALEWLDRFASQQILFSDKEIDRIRRKLARATPTQARQWLEETRDLRVALDSPRWQETRKWLKQFLEVQAIYSEEQIAQFKREVKRLPPDQLRRVLDEIEAKRAAMVQRSASADQLRRQMLQVNQAYRQEQFAQREAAQRAASRAAAQRPTRPSPPVANRTRQQKAPPPLIDSLDVARWSVIRSIYPRW